MLAVNEQNRFVAIIKEAEIIFVDGRADSNQPTDAVVRDPDFQAHAGAKGKSAERDLLLRIILCQVIQTGAHVFLFTTAFVVLACALSHATKVDSQGYEAGV